MHKLCQIELLHFCPSSFLERKVFVQVLPSGRERAELHFLVFAEWSQTSSPEGKKKLGKTCLGHWVGSLEYSNHPQPIFGTVSSSSLLRWGVDCYHPLFWMSLDGWLSPPPRSNQAAEPEPGWRWWEWEVEKKNKQAAQRKNERKLDQNYVAKKGLHLFILFISSRTKSKRTILGMMLFLRLVCSVWVFQVEPILSTMQTAASHGTTSPTAPEHTLRKKGD